VHLTPWKRWLRMITHCKPVLLVIAITQSDWSSYDPPCVSLRQHIRTRSYHTTFSRYSAKRWKTLLFSVIQYSINAIQREINKTLHSHMITRALLTLL
jgi:hypothetical protein